MPLRPRLFLARLSLVLLLAAPAAAQDAPVADVAVQKGVYEEDVFVGEEATFFIAVTNYGPDASTGLAVADVLPEGLIYGTAWASYGRYDADTGAWHVGTLAPGQTERLELTTVVTSEHDVQNCASVHASDQRDPEASNDADCAYVYVRPKREKMVPLAMHVTDAVPTPPFLR